MLTCRLPLIGIALALWLVAGGAAAGTLVEFANVSEQAPKLRGYLARPGLEGPYPAVVVLHGCGGISGHAAGIADRLRAWGYVALVVDSFGSRGIVNHCDSPFPDQAFDAYAALHYLAGLEIVDPTRVAVLGQSLGGSAVLYAVDRDLAAQYFNNRFRAAIAYYPTCAIAFAATMTAPTLILIGEADDWTPAEPCRTVAAHARPGSAPIAVTAYPGVFHGFDVAQLVPGTRYRGHRLEYDEPAANDAEAKVRDFLATYLGAAPANKPATQ